MILGDERQITNCVWVDHTLEWDHWHGWNTYLTSLSQVPVRYRNNINLLRHWLRAANVLLLLPLTVIIGFLVSSYLTIQRRSSIRILKNANMRHVVISSPTLRYKAAGELQVCFIQQIEWTKEIIRSIFSRKLSNNKLTGATIMREPLLRSPLTLVIVFRASKPNLSPQGGQARPCGRPHKSVVTLHAEIAEQRLIHKAQTLKIKHLVALRTERIVVINPNTQSGDIEAI